MEKDMERIYSLKEYKIDFISGNEKYVFNNY